MTPLAQQPRRSRSLIAWLALVLLIGVGHVVPALHFLFVAHHLCAEHGELVDAVSDAAITDAAIADAAIADAAIADAARAEGRGTSQDKAGGSQLAASTGQAADSAAVRASGAGVHSHEHCDVFAATRVAPALAAAPAPAQLLPAVQLPPSPGEAREAHVDIGLLHYAPKLAPPARA